MNNPPTLSIIVPTIGRETLPRTLETIAAQELVDGDEVLVVEDGPDNPAIREPIEAAGWPWRYLSTGKRFGGWGHVARNVAMTQARGDYLVFMDDDDVYRTHGCYGGENVGAFARIRAAATRHPGRPLMFRMERPGWNSTIWRPKAVRYGNVSTQMFVVPNSPELLGSWGPYHAGDLAFICSTLEKWPPGSLVWEPDIIAIQPKSGTPSPDHRPMMRNLIYHVYPVASNEEWRPNVERLAQSWHLFNGRKIVGIVTDGETIGPYRVIEAFPPDPQTEFLIQDNDPDRGETVTFLPAVKMLRNWNGDEATFYGHAKGTSPRRHAKPGEIDRIRRWRDFMYRHTLEVAPAKLDWALRRFACAGSLKIHRSYRQEPGRPPSYWHFSGTFFWFHHARFFALPEALELGPSRYAVERHLGEIIPEGEAYCFAGDHIERKDTWVYNLTAADWDRLEAEAA